MTFADRARSVMGVNRHAPLMWAGAGVVLVAVAGGVALATVVGGWLWTYRGDAGARSNHMGG